MSDVFAGGRGRGGGGGGDGGGGGEDVVVGDMKELGGENVGKMKKMEDVKKAAGCVVRRLSG
jgi:hypothetical protein